MLSTFRRLTPSIISVLLCLTVASIGLSQSSFASAKYSDLEIGKLHFSDVSTCLASNKNPQKIYECTSPSVFIEQTQYPQTVWAFSIKNKSKTAYTKVRVEIILQNNTGADLYNNILLVTSRIEPGETLWVAPEWDYTKGPTSQSKFQGVTQGTAKIISAKKSQPGKYRIKGFAEGDISSISDDPLRYSTSSFYDEIWSSANNGVFEDFAYRIETTLPVAVDRNKVPLQWITVLYKESDGKILGGFKFQNNSSGPPYKWGLMQDKDYLKRLVTLEVYVGRR